jgi:hypothetical protein
MNRPITVAEVDSLRWLQSPRCDNSSGNCPEIADLGDGGWAIRNTKNPHTVVGFDANEWRVLTVGLALDEFGAPK